MYFEIDLDKDPSPQIKLSDFVLEKDNAITEQSLLDLGFYKSLSKENCFYKNYRYYQFYYNIETKNIGVINMKTNTNFIFEYSHIITIECLKESVSNLFFDTL